MAVDIDEILALPLEERRALMCALERSVGDELGFELSDAEWDEIEARIDEYRRNPASGILARDLLKEFPPHA